MATYLVVNDKGEYFIGFVKSESNTFSKSTRLGGFEPKFVPFTNHATTVLLVDDQQLDEMESDLKQFGISFKLIEVSH